MSESLTTGVPPAADGLAETATATRDGLALASGPLDGVRIGVGIGVRLLRVSVAAAPGTGVGSAPSSVEHAVATSAAATATPTTASRRGTQAV
jgi:hypothetical protein